MRDIRFRGLNHETGEWVYGWYTKLVEGVRRFDAIISEVNGELTRFYIHHAETIGQFTGLRDSKGQDIYEGDILKTDEAGWIAKVIWSYDGFILTGLDNTGFSCSPNYAGCEVIGNIHEKTLDNIEPSA